MYVRKTAYKHLLVNKYVVHMQVSIHMCTQAVHKSLSKRICVHTYYPQKNFVSIVNYPWALAKFQTADGFLNPFLLSYGKPTYARTLEYSCN